VDVDFAFLCDSAQESGGKLHALGIGIDGVFAPALPTTHAVVLVAQFRYWAAEAGTRPLAVRLIDADGRSLSTADGQIVFGDTQDNPTGAARVLLTLNALPFDHYGDYAIHITIAGDDVVRLPLRVMAPRP
jgi:hypothetical protein